MKRYLCVFAAIAAFSNFAVAQHHKNEAVEIKVTKAADKIYMIEGKGGNIGVLLGDDETVIIDSQFDDLSDSIKSEIHKLSFKPIKFLVNTHYHGDHTGGNSNFAKDGAYIISHEFVRDKLKTGTYIKAFNRTMEPAPKEALPFITYQKVMHIHEGDEDIELAHYKAHTGGDTVVFFNKSNVVHTGDVYFNGRYPFIDTSNGGSVQGMISSMEDVISKVDEKTVIIPGHGPISDKNKMVENLNMLKDFYQTVMYAKESGKSKDEILKMSEIQKYDADYGQTFLSTEQFVGIVYGE